MIAMTEDVTMMPFSQIRKVSSYDLKNLIVSLSQPEHTAHLKADCPG
jgi:hypothetical protein